MEFAMLFVAGIFGAIVSRASVEKIVTKDLSALTIGRILFVKMEAFASTKTSLVLKRNCLSNRACEISLFCRQIGAKAMTCECTDDYVGRNCEIHLMNTMEGRFRCQ